MTQISTAVPEIPGLPHTWHADVLFGPPMIQPARSFVLPQAVAGEEDALARGALWLSIRPREGGTFLVQCALGFSGAGVASGVWPTPDADILLAIAGGYAYRIPTLAPEAADLLPLRPVVAVHPVPDAGAVVLAGFHHLTILDAGGAWESPRLSWEGIVVTGAEGDVLHGTGWHMRTDREVPWALNLRTREVTGGGFTP
jgi:hypothetical protein